jgi:hypothetical protein
VPVVGLDDGEFIHRCVLVYIFELVFFMRRLKMIIKTGGELNYCIIPPIYSKGNARGRRNRY